MSQLKVFVTRLIPEVGLERLRTHCQLEVWEHPLPPPRETLIERLQGCDGLLCLLSDAVDAEVMDAAGGKLKVISNYAVGFNNIDLAAANARGIRVGNTPGVLTDATADIAVGLLLAAARCIVQGQLYVLDGQWRTWEPRGHLGVDLVGKTLGIVGLGRIGMAVAKRLHGGWGMRVLYHNRTPNPDAEEQLGAELVDFDTLLAQSDFVSIHASLNESNRGIFDAAAFRKMKKSAVLINTARGQHVVQTDLVAALQAGEIFAAGLDVTDPEPPSPDDPLLNLPNVVIAPHVGSATFSTRDQMATIAAENVLAGLRQEPLPHWVNPECEKPTSSASS